MKEKCPSRCSADVFSRVDLAARAREAQGDRLHDALRSDPASPPPRRDLLGPGPLLVRSSTWQWIAFPARSYRRSLLTTSLVRRSRRARSPPLSGRSACGLRLPGRVGAARRRPRSSRPMSAAHGFCFQKRSPRVSAHVASQCSHAIRELADSRRNAHFGEPTDRARVLSSPAADPVGVPLMPRRLRALPAELCPPASARHRFRDLRSKPEGLGPLHQAA